MTGRARERRFYLGMVALAVLLGAIGHLGAAIGIMIGLGIARLI